MKSENHVVDDLGHHKKFKLMMFEGGGGLEVRSPCC